MSHLIGPSHTLPKRPFPTSEDRNHGKILFFLNLREFSESII